jgi:hypothetical protein
MIKRFRNETAPVVEFIQHHQPALDSGTYRVDLEQAITGAKISEQALWTRRLTFVVQGERFSTLAPHEVSGVFPPEGSLGDHMNVLPHITLTRSTLPWERSPDNKHPEPPWLALLLFWESDFASKEDVPVPQPMTLRELMATTGAKFPDTELEPGQDPSDGVTVIDVKKRLLDAVLPRKNELGYLAHVRQLKDESGELLPGINALATVFSNRLPQEGGTSTAFLVSVEGRYEQDRDAFDFQGAGEDDLIRLVCLKSWRFTCIDPEQSFTALLTNVNRVPGTLRLPDLEAGKDGGANEYLRQGYLPLPHALRQGDRTVSWFHGPLSPGDVQDAVTLPALTADELVRYETQTGMFDTSYAAAWTLGRMLTLQNQAVALALYQWKRSGGIAQRQAEQRLAARRLSRMPFRAARSETPRPASVEAWFDDLCILRGVPFEYLVPDERMLPAESLRFFRVDRRWMKCLLDGAYSIGRVTEGDRRREMRRSGDSPVGEADRLITGFLLRSSVVSGWPDLLVDGFDVVVPGNDFQPPEDRLFLLRMERLSSNVLICLFDGEVKTVDIHLKPEAMHFGVDAPTGDPLKFHKTMRNPATGEEIEGHPLDIPWYYPARLVINIGQLALEMQAVRGRSTFTSAPFALQMIEGVQKVRFTQKA